MNVPLLLRGTARYGTRKTEEYSGDSDVLSVETCA